MGASQDLGNSVDTVVKSWPGPVVVSTENPRKGLYESRVIPQVHGVAVFSRQVYFARSKTKKEADQVHRTLCTLFDAERRQYVHKKDGSYAPVMG